MFYTIFSVYRVHCAMCCAKLLQSYLTLCNPMNYSLPGSSVHGDSLGKNTGVDCHALLQGISLTQGSNPPLLCHLHWQMGSLSLVPPWKASTHYAFPLIHKSYDTNWLIVWGFKEFRGKEREWTDESLLHTRLKARHWTLRN